MHLQGSFKTNYGSLIYTVSNASITNPGTIIKSIYDERASSQRAVGFNINKSAIEFLPHGLMKLFPNITRLSVTFCGLKMITRRDLSELENLEMLGLAGNELQMLPNDLFEDMEKLTWIDFADNKLEFVSSKIFKPIMANNFKRVDFTGNKNFDVRFCHETKGAVKMMRDLMKIIDENCRKLDENLHSENFGENPDFIIIGGPTRARSWEM